MDTPEQWRTWLSEYAAASPGVWLITWKKGHGAYLTYDDIVDEALCLGWIDSRPRTIDAHRTARLVTPRRPGSNWSQVNKERVRRLTAAGLMTPAGLAAVDLAQPDGFWAALDEVEQLREPAAVPQRAGNAVPGRTGTPRHERELFSHALVWVDGELVWQVSFEAELDDRPLVGGQLSFDPDVLAPQLGPVDDPRTWYRVPVAAVELLTHWRPGRPEPALTEVTTSVAPPQRMWKNFTISGVSAIVCGAIAW